MLLLQNGLNSLNPEWTGKAEILGRFLDLLFEKNKVMNLTSITDEKEAVIKHLIDSLTLAKYIDFKESAFVADVGSGAGLPGVPLAIVRPDLKIVFIDSLQKRLNFIDETMQKLGLLRYECVHLRAEQAGREEKYRGKFDVSVARAVARLNVLSEYCVPLLKVNGFFAAMKGPDCTEEQAEAKNAFKKLGAKQVKEWSFILPGSDYGRKILLYKKTATTQNAYPREAGKITKNPL